MEIVALAAFGYAATWLAVRPAPEPSHAPPVEDTQTVTSIRQRIGDAIGSGAELGAAPYLADVDPTVLAVMQMGQSKPPLIIPQYHQGCQYDPPDAPGGCQYMPVVPPEQPLPVERPIDNTAITIRKAPQELPLS